MSAYFIHLRSCDEGSRQSHVRPRNIENTFVRVNPPNALFVARERDVVAVEGLLSLSRKRKREASMLFSDSTFHAASSPDVNELQAPSTDTESLKSEKLEEVATQWTATQENYQRELRRERQIRYRKKQNDHMKMLEMQTHELRQEIEKVEQRRRTVATVPAKEGLWNVALEYFSLFRHGLQPTRRASAASGQLEFLRASMSPDVVFNMGRGTEAMMRSWKCVSLWFQDVELEQLEQENGSGFLVATTTTRITITERTLRNVFPHLSSGSARYNGLAAKLLGQRITMHGSIRFEWDPAHCCVSSVTTHSDLLTPMTRVLGSLEDASLVFERAIISPDFQWRLTAN